MLPDRELIKSVDTGYFYSIVYRFVNKYGFEFDSYDVSVFILNEAARCIGYAKENKPDVLGDKSKFRRLFSVILRNRLIDITRANKRYDVVSSNTINDAAGIPIVHSMRVPNEIIEYVSRVQKGRKVNINRMREKFGESAVGILSRVVQTSAIVISEKFVGGKMFVVKISTLEKKFIQKKTAIDDIGEKPMSVVLLAMKEAGFNERYVERVQHWFETGCVLNTAPSDCFGVGFDAENNEECKPENCVGCKECDEATTMFTPDAVKEIADKLPSVVSTKNLKEANSDRVRDFVYQAIGIRLTGRDPVFPNKIKIFAGKGKLNLWLPVSLLSELEAIIPLDRTKTKKVTLSTRKDVEYVKVELAVDDIHKAGFAEWLKKITTSE
jgi:hypothetical protein